MKPSYYAARGASKKTWAVLCCVGCLVCMPLTILFAWALMPAASISFAMAAVLLIFIAVVHAKDAARLEDRAVTERYLQRREEWRRSH